MSETASKYKTGYPRDSSHKGVQTDRVLAYLRLFLKGNDRLPTKAEVGTRFKVSPNGALWHLRKLMDQKVLERGGKRGWKFVR